MSEPNPTPSRRRFLGLAGGGLVAAGVAGCTRADTPAGTTAAGSAAATPSAGPVAASTAPVSPTGRHQAGITTPSPAQPHLLSAVYDLDATPGPVLAAIGRTVLDLVAGRAGALAGMAPNDLTVTVGVGPRLVAAVDPRLPGAQELPRFPRERLRASDDGGDVLVQVCASDPLLLPGALSAVAAAGGPALRERWRQAAFRGPDVRIGPHGTAPRNLLGYIDGIVVPRTAADQERDVWLPSSSPLAGATIAVVRRMEIDLERFLAADVAVQDATIGRRRATGAPLSGGTIATNPDLGAKTPQGAYEIPADAHVRRANPVMTGVPTMLRRSYSFADAASGLFFVSFQNALHTFVATLNRMSTSDALLEYTTTTRSGTFLILPGFGPRTPLGAQLFDR